MITPYTYQDECLNRIVQARLQGAARALVVMATRLGKTITAAFDVKRFISSRKSRVLYLCHKTDILYQSRSVFKMIVGTDRSYGFFHGKEKDFHEVDCLFSSFETMANWIDTFRPDEFDYIIVDESHHSHAETYLKTIKYFKPKFLLGITATPDRMDQQDITEIYGEPVFNLSLEKALAAGYLTPVDYRILTDEIQTEKIIQAPDKRWSISALNRQIFVPKRDEEIARIIALYTSKIENPKTIIFCSSVKHCDHLVAFIPDSLPLHSKIPIKERDIRLEMFRQNMLNTVITVDCFNEGIDIPRANVIVFLRSTASKTIFLQQLGRGLTKSEGKDKVVVLDFVANIKRVKTIQEMRQKVTEYIPPNRKQWSDSERQPISLDIGKIQFLEEKISFDELLDRVVKKDHYPTWQEASQAAQKLKIIGRNEYEERYKEDSCLPSRPHQFYTDFPGYYVFLGTEPPDIYKTWKEASAATIKLGIKSQKKYYKQYSLDDRLPSSPNQKYADFPGWNKFLGTSRRHNHYPTWQQASAVALALGLDTPEKYRAQYSVDDRLPSSPNKQYADFPGWIVFLGKKSRDYYPTWQEASVAVQKLGIRTVEEFTRRYTEDPRLNSSPHRYYKDFPGAAVFFGKEAR